MSEVRNLHTDPHAYRKRGTWNGAAQENGEKWRYALAEGVSNGTMFAWAGMSMQQLSGLVLYARVLSGSQMVLDRLSIENATLLVRRDGWCAARVADGNTSNHTLPLVNGTLVLEEVAAYTPADWERVYDLYQRGVLRRPFFAGDTFGGGVSPLSFSSTFRCACPRLGVCA